MYLLSLKSQLINPGDDIIPAISSALENNKETLKEEDLLVIASKAAAYSQGRLVSVKDKDEFRKLIKKEADKVLEDGDMVLTMKNKVMIPNAGIDNSNTPKGEVVLWPEKPFDSARDIRERLQKEYSIGRLGILLSDSHCQPMRMGTSGIAIGWAGFEGVLDERGKKDLFGKDMQYTQIAVADDLACAANLLMGETDASMPFVIIRGYDNIEWTEEKASEEDYFISPEECIYKSLYNHKMSL